MIDESEVGLLAIDPRKGFFLYKCVFADQSQLGLALRG